MTLDFDAVMVMVIRNTDRMNSFSLTNYYLAHN